MKVGEPRDLSRAVLEPEGARLRFGPFIGRVRVHDAATAQGFHFLHRQREVLAANEIADFHIVIKRRRSVTNPLRHIAEIDADGWAPFPPTRSELSLPLLEWGMNWCIATRAHDFLLLHAGVAVRNEIAVVLPAEPGSGKSTLSAGLMFRGWTLYSDEFGLIDLRDASVRSIPRPIPLKNRSIELLRSFDQRAELGPEFMTERKGLVCHLRPTPESAATDNAAAPVRLLIFPRYVEASATKLTSEAKGIALIDLCANSFNFRMLGQRGFETAAKAVDGADCYRLTYSDLEEAVATITELADAY